MNGTMNEVTVKEKNIYIHSFQTHCGFHDKRNETRWKPNETLPKQKILIR